MIRNLLTILLLALAALSFSACAVDATDVAAAADDTAGTTGPETVIYNDGDQVITSTKTVFNEGARASAGGEVWRVSQELLKYYRGGGTMYISGQLKVTVGVKNLAYDKVVGIRYTKNNWGSYTDANGTWSRSINSGADEFLTLSDSNIAPGTKVGYAIYYKVLGKTYWDNNYSKNYTAQF